MKEMTSVTEVMMTEEDKEEINNSTKTPVAGSPAETPAVTPGVPHPEQTPAAAAAAAGAAPATTTSPVTQDGPAEAHAPHTGDVKDKDTTAPTASTSAAGHVATPSGTSTPTKERLEKEHAGSPRKRAKLTPEQKAKIDQIGEERDKAMEARVEQLTIKLKDVS